MANGLTRGGEKEQKKKFDIPVFEYGEKVRILQNNEFPTENSNQVTAEFYQGQVGTVVDVSNYSEEIEYLVKLDKDLGHQYSDTNGKYIWIQEEFLGDFQMEEERCNSFCNKECDKKNSPESFKELVKEGIQHIKMIVEEIKDEEYLSEKIKRANITMLAVAKAAQEYLDSLE